MPLAEPGAPTGAPHEDPLLERDDVLDAWRALLDVAGSGGGSLYLEGAPGIGKTRLADELACRATDAGFRVLCATGGELEQHFAFGIVHQLFDRLAATCPELLFAAHAAPARALLAPTGAEENAEEAALTHALFWLLANLAEQGPVALVIDDLHWSDAPSLAWLAYLERRLGDLPVAMLLTARPGADGVLERLRSSNRVLRPGELSLASVATLVGGGSPDACEPDDPFVEACHRATGGNPFLVRELVHALRERGVAGDARGAELVRTLTPERIVSWIGLRLDACSVPAAALGRAFAVLTPGMALAAVARVAGVDVQLAPELQRELVDAHLLEDGAPAGGFRHPIVRAAIAERLDAHERGMLHRRAADVLTTLGASPDEVATHLAETPPTGDRCVVERLRHGAAVLLERGAPRLAARMLERAVDEGCELDVTERAELHRALGGALARAGSEHADRWLESAISLEQDPLQRARDAVVLGRARFTRGRFAESREAYERGRDVLEAAGIEHELSLELSAGWAASVVFTPAMLEPEIATRVEQLVQEMLEPRSVVERIALGHMAGLEMLMSGRRDVVERMARAAWGDGALMREAGVDEPAIWAVTAAAYGLGDLDRVLRVTDLVAANATSAGAPLAAATAACVRSLALLQRGDVTGAFADVERAVQVSGSLGDTRHWDTFLPAALSVGAHALIARGELERAEALLTLSDEQEAAWSQLLLYLPLLEARGYLELARDRPAESMRHWDRHLKLTTRHFGREVNSAFHGGWRCGATEALVQLGRHDEALELALVELDNARSWGQARAIGRALRAVGRARGADGVDDLAAGAALLEQHGLLLDLAWTLHDFASGLRAAGRRREAREQLQRALELADRIEARHLSARAREALVAIGGSPSRERSSGARSLTAAERRVARLAADGLSNREIAERLFVTMHAIRFHLRNAYAKLQVDGRDQLAGALRELDDEPSRSG